MAESQLRPYDDFNKIKPLTLNPLTRTAQGPTSSREAASMEEG